LEVRAELWCGQRPHHLRLKTSCRPFVTIL
jgi:hypothetical protein